MTPGNQILERTRHNLLSEWPCALCHSPGRYTRYQSNTIPDKSKMDTSSRKEVTTNSAVQTEHLETAHNMNIHLETAHDLNVHNATIFDDPHKAAIEDSPEHAARPPLSTFLAILVSISCPCETSDPSRLTRGEVPGFVVTSNYWSPHHCCAYHFTTDW